MLLLVGCATTPQVASVPDGVQSTLDLNGAATSVVWTDGDTFTFRDGPRRGLEARLMGVNALETYGPVHRWGDWRPEDLLTLARHSADVVAGAAEACRASGKKDKYGRLLVDCPDGRAELLRTGHGHLYPFDRDAAPGDIALQADARRERRGMWARGVPTEIVTRVDAATAENGWTAANWVVSTDDGRSRRVGHREEHAVCDEVCVGRPPAVPSCLVWVPWERRYTNRPPCLQAGPP